jgi:thiol-disulfide isomerase/thioredoxin
VPERHLHHDGHVRLTRAHQPSSLTSGPHQTRRLLFMIRAMRRPLFVLAALVVMLVAPAAVRADWPADLRVVSPADTLRAVRAARGRVTLLVYWAAWCGDCRRELPDLEALQTELPKVRLLAYTIDEDPAPLERLLERGPLRIPLVRVATTDPNEELKPALQAVARSFGGDYRGAIPYLALFDRRGKLVREWTRGKPVDPAELRDAIRPLL